MLPFRLVKLYADLIAADGTVLIAYMVDGRVALASRGAIGLELYAPDGTRRVTRAPLPHAREAIESCGGELHFDHGGIELDLRYERTLPPWRPPPADRDLAWRVEIPRARAWANVRWDGVAAELEGEGYVDRVDLGRAPSRLGLRRIEWARIHAGDVTAVGSTTQLGSGPWSRSALWIGTEGPHECRVEADPAGGLRVESPAAGVALTLEPARTFHDGPAFDSDRFPGRGERELMQTLVGRATERRRLLSRDGVPAALHEVVTFD